VRAGLSRALRLRDAVWETQRVDIPAIRNVALQKTPLIQQFESLVKDFC
jgi:hypothetical protein